jgi:hypothetical protein
MDGIDYWKLCDEFTVIQAALLIIGEDPAGTQDYIEQWESQNRPQGFDACFAALKNAINAGRLKATIRRVAWERGFNEDPGPDELCEIDGRKRQIIYKADSDWGLSTIQREDLTEWLSSRNFKPAFFFEQKTDAPDYLDPKHPKYSPKLAAAIRAWEAVTTDPRYNNNGKTPKANIENWLNSHAAEYDLVKEDGENNADAIKNQIAKVANWQTDGGAPKTPSK